MPKQRNQWLYISIFMIAIGLLIVFQFYGSASNAESQSADIVSIENKVDKPNKNEQETMTIAMGSKKDKQALNNNNTDAVSNEYTLEPRVLGNDNATVVIEEYASLTCSHCADFHEDIFPALKAEYIDTGKVKFIFNDFPLNGPALDGAMIARCLPEQNYYKFISFLFNTQSKWAYERDHLQKLRQNSKLLGLGDEEFDNCIKNDELKNAIVSHMETKSEEYGIKSTPTFVIDGQDVLRGSRSIEAFRKIIDPKLLQNGTPTE
jgi:protein-disulfide isomerase